REQPTEERAPPGGEGIVGAGVDAELPEALLDQAIVLRLVAGLSREGELCADLRRRRDPRRRALRRLDLVLPREEEQPRPREIVARRPAGGRRGDAIQRPTVLRVELLEESRCARHDG